MSTSGKDAQMPSATGVRVAGDRYQWMYAWSSCLDLLADAQDRAHTNPGIAVGIEVPGVVPLDDVVYYRAHAPHTFAQVKWAVDATSPVNKGYIAKDNLLKRIYERWIELTAEGDPVEVVLVSTREVDGNDELASRRDTRTGKLVPRGAQYLPVALRTSRQSWATSAATTEEGLLGLLSDMRFETGLDFDRLWETIRLKMRASGLKSDDSSIQSAVSWIETQVVAGTRRIDLESVQRYAETVRRSEPWSRVSIATIVPDTNARTARVAIDWTDQMDGDGEAFWTVSPKPPHTWTELANDLDRLPAQVAPAKRVLISGSMRQATGFYAGSLFRRVLKFEVATEQGASFWPSDARAIKYTPGIEMRELGEGGELAVLTCIAAGEAADSVESYVRSSLPRVGRLLVVRPSNGITGTTAISDPESAAAFAQATVSAARTYAPEDELLHLFQAGPLGVSVLLGHYWNRVAPTLAYEHLGRSRYSAAFQVQA